MHTDRRKCDRQAALQLFFRHRFGNSAGRSNFSHRFHRGSAAETSE
ncbi:MAG: hypothetical protein ACFE0J_22910 [Elainellaceae cyanobacterium]